MLEAFFAQLAVLVLSHLQKRLLSSIEAFAKTLAVYRKGLERRAGRAARQAPSRRDLAYLVAPPDADDDVAELSEEELEAEIETQLHLAVAADPNVPTEAEIELLDRMRDVADQARDDADRRVLYLIEWIREHMLEEDGRTWKTAASSGRNGGENTGADEATPRRLLIFTEYTDTKRYLEEHLRAALAATDDAARRVGTFVGRGAMVGSRGQEEIRRAFNADPAEHPCASSSPPRRPAKA